MKQTLICLTVAALAALTSLQAGDQCAKEKSATTAEVKTTCSAEAKTSCCASKEVAAAKSSCSAPKVAKRRVIEKGAVVLAGR